MEQSKIYIKPKGYTYSDSRTLPEEMYGTLAKLIETTPQTYLLIWYGERYEVLKDTAEIIIPKTKHIKRRMTQDEAHSYTSCVCQAGEQVVNKDFQPIEIHLNGSVIETVENDFSEDFIIDLRDLPWILDEKTTYVRDNNV